MKKNLLLISALFLSMSVLKAEEQKQSSQTEPKVNIGLKAGFNSSMYFTSRLQLDGQRFEDIQNNYKVGYFAALFFRFNMKRHFIQPEFTYNVNKGDITFDKNQNTPTRFCHYPFHHPFIGNPPVVWIQLRQKSSIRHGILHRSQTGIYLEEKDERRILQLWA